METDVIVLECSDHGESDVIVTLFSRDNGRMTAIAKGAKKSLKRFVNKLEIFSFLHVVCQRKTPASLAFLAEADLHCAFFNIRLHLELYVVATVIREFLLIAVKDNEPDERIFQLSLWALHQLDQNHAPRTILALFLIRFFEYVGYRPNLDNCGRCQGQVSLSGPSSFLPAAGTLLCSRCLDTATPMSSLSQGTLKMLRSAQNLPLERLDRLRLSEPLLQESLSMLHAYGRCLFQRDIVSWRHLWRQPRRKS